MKDSFEFTLNNPLTEEQWDMITDVDFDQTDRITFHTKHGKEVEFAKVIRCNNCAHYNESPVMLGYCMKWGLYTEQDGFCYKAEQAENAK